MKRKYFMPVVACLAGAFVVILGSAYALRRKPVLFHIFADTGCACGEYHEEVSGLIARNPFRDSAPEKAAGDFLKDLREGRCTADATLCGYALNGHRVSDWRLASRHDNGEAVMLYYRLTRYPSYDPKYDLTGEGLVGVVHERGTWRVTNYSSYF